MPGPKIPPTRNDSKVRSIDDSAARSVKGYISSLALDDPSGTVPGWVMVFAETYPAAIRAADLVKVDWAVGEGANVSEQDILDHGAKQIADPKGGVFLVDDDGLDAAFRAAKSTLDADLHDAQRPPCPARARQCARLREGRHLRDPHRQSVADADPAGACRRRSACRRSASCCVPTISAAASDGGSTATMPCRRRSPPRRWASRSRWC